MEKRTSLYDLPKEVLIEKVIPLIQEDKDAEIAKLKKQIEILCDNLNKIVDNSKRLTAHLL